MNTQVKVGIAAAIVAALVALIVLDQKTTPKEDPSRVSSGGDPATILSSQMGAEPPAQRMSDAENRRILEAAQVQFGETTKPAPEKTPVKGTEEKNEKAVPVANEEYVIKPGDTLETIAQAKYGSKSFAPLIAAANPNVKPTALKVGGKIALPSKQKPVVERKEESPVVNQDATTVSPLPPAQPEKPRMDSFIGAKTYTVAPGDTLSGISVKVYNTSRHYQKIYDANKDAIEDPNTLQVGLKLTMPELPVKSTTPNTGAPGTGTTATTLVSPTPAPAAAGAKTVTVGQGDRLWNIAAKIAAERKIGILDMIKIIVDANVDKKIREDGSNLQAGWTLTIPE